MKKLSVFFVNSFQTKIVVMKPQRLRRPWNRAFTKIVAQRDCLPGESAGLYTDQSRCGDKTWWSGVCSCGRIIAPPALLSIDSGDAGSWRRMTATQVWQDAKKFCRRRSRFSRMLNVPERTPRFLTGYIPTERAFWTSRESLCPCESPWFCWCAKSTGRGDKHSPAYGKRLY